MIKLVVKLGKKRFAAVNTVTYHIVVLIAIVICLMVQAGKASF